jgi:hypothetical protein
MRLVISFGLIALALLISAATVDVTPVISVAYAKSAKETGHGAGYQPPVDQSKLNCKQLSGRIQVLILQLRGDGDRKKPSALSLGLHSMFASTVGTTKTGSDPEGAQSADMKRLKDYNQRLAAMGCKSYDLDYELKQTDPLVSPSPRVLPPKKMKAH